MAAIEKIAIEVPSTVAAAYRRATDSERQKIANRIGLMLRASKVSKQESIGLLKQTMDSISDEATANGLTPEILESILND